MKTQQPLVPGITRGLTTEELAVLLSMNPQSVRKRLSQTGSYFGLRPVKLPNRRLVWEADAVARFLCGKGA